MFRWLIDSFNEWNDGPSSRNRDALSRALEQHKLRQAEHRRERLTRGLSEEAKSGKTEPAIMMCRIGKKIDFLDQEFPSHQAMIQERDDRIVQTIPLGASRIGGLPDLPPTIEWPREELKRLPFLAQINLSDTANFASAFLPAQGWLYAFGCIGEISKDRHNVISVFVHDGPTDALVRAKRPKIQAVWPDWTGVRVYEPVPIQFKLKPDDHIAGNSYGADRDAGWLFGEMFDQPPGYIADMRFLEGDDWITFLSLGSVGSMQWSDVGQLHFIARRSDLARRDYSNLLTTICSG